jgi:hypothetical protein
VALISIKDVLDGLDAREWTLTIQVEIQYLKVNKTWELIIHPKGKISLPSIWVFEIKTKLDGSIDKFKARLIARGFSQIQSVDYIKSFSHVVKLNSIKVLLVIAIQYDLEMHQLDEKTTF